MGKIVAVVSFHLLAIAASAQPNGMTARQASAYVARQQALQYRPPVFYFDRKRRDSGNYDPTSNVKVQYFVMKKDSSGINVKSKIYLADDGRYFLSTENKAKGDEAKRIYPAQTIKINFVDYRELKTVEAIANDSAWLFRVLEGRISLYDCYPPQSEVWNGEISAFQVGEGAIEPLREERLKQAMLDNPKALKFLDAGDIVKAVKTYNNKWLVSTGGFAFSTGFVVRARMQLKLNW